MSEFTWGDMPKSQVDPQLITQAISEAIGQHESDPTAHLGIGESLEQHKTNEVIDHPAFSVLDDKFAYDRNSLNAPLSNLSLFAKGSNVENQGVNCVYFYSSGLNHTEWLYGSMGDMVTSSEFNYQNNPRFITDIRVGSLTNHTIYILVGERDEGHGFGFKLVNGTLYGMYYDSSLAEHTISLQTISANTNYKLEARVTYPDTIEFFVNNLLVGTMSSITLPSSIGYILSIPWVDVKRTATGATEFWLRGFYWEAEYPS